MAVSDPSKFRQIYNLENQILVESDYDNIILIDPNKVVDNNGVVKDRLVQQENLVMYANLQTKIIPRTKLAIGESFDSPVYNTTIASLGSGDEDLNLNFLRPKGKRAFDTSWSDEYTGRGSRQGKSLNQNAEYKKTQNGTTKISTKVLNYEDTQTLGIISIRVKITSIGVPSVSIEMEDVRGRALFEQGENSLYSVFFNLPYPTFYLILKGFYGKAIKYQLTLTNFNAKFDPGSGNFRISLKLLGRNSAILADSIVGFAKHTPKMFQTQVKNANKKKSSNSTGSNTTKLKILNNTIGRQKLSEVYSIYKDKKFIDKNFPEIDMETFIYRCGNYNGNVQAKIDNGDFDVINDLEEYQNTLNELKKRVYVNPLSDFLDTSERIFISTSKGGKIYYPYLESISINDQKSKKQNVEKDFNFLVKKLNDNTSFGKNGKYVLPGKNKKESGEITNNLDFSDITTRLVDFNTISRNDFKKSYEINYGNTPSNPELDKYINEFKTLNRVKNTIIDSSGNPISVNPELYFFGDKVDSTTGYYKNSFLDKLNVMSNELNSKRTVIEDALSKELQNILVNSKNGLGFNPTIRNVFAVLFAGLDAFYRMMEEVHISAWRQRKNPIRLDQILPSGRNVGTDAVDIINGTKQLNQENTVYPWPQYFELETTKDGGQEYVIKYPGDAFIVSKTKGYNSQIWPEIAFTEEFITASLQKNSPVIATPTGNQLNATNFMSVSAIEFPFGTLPYQNISEVNFLYEIFERSYLGSNYTKINRGNYKVDQIDKFLGDIEGENIKTSLESSISPNLIYTLKNFTPNFTTYLNNLKTISNNGSGAYWTNYSNSNYNINYIKNYITTGTSEVYSVDTLIGTSIQISGNIPLKNKIKNFINDNASSGEYYLDPYPFSDINWLKNNLQDGSAITSVNNFYKTKSLIYLDEKKTIGRIDENENIQNINLFIDKFAFANYDESNYLLDQQNNVIVDSRDTLRNYYLNKKNKYLYFTESFIDYGNQYSGNVQTNIQTTSLLNTPYFINSLQKGVDNQRNNIDDPYVSLGYIFLNSLPLITTKEKLKSTLDNNTEPTELDYLAATFNKFSSIHKLPYSWVLKYGSIWYRYKKFIKEGIDILDDVWQDFDYKTNYDPINSATTTSYAGSWVGNIILENSIAASGSPIYSATSFSASTIDTVNYGFYPKVINDVYRFFYNKDLDILQSPTQANFISLNNDYGFSVVSNYFKGFNEGFDDQNQKRNISITNYCEFFTKPNGDNDNVLVIPSMGAIKINQSVFECFNNLDKKTEELFDNNSVYNGTVRSLWSAPNFGYYDNSLIKKPKYNEYIKTIDNTNNKKQSSFNLNNNDLKYSSIEEIFAIFEPKILDEFERLFLSFCNPNPNAKDLILKNEQTNSTFTNIGQVNNVKEKRLFNQIESLFLIPKTSITFVGDDNTDSINISKAQMNNFAGSLIDFLNFECVLKIGNPSNFDRRLFNFFTNNSQFLPITSIPLSPYTVGSLPGDGSTPATTLISSQSALPEEWNLLKQYVGEFQETDIVYANSGSVITDFFIDNDIEFTKNNIEKLYPLIRIYAKEKLKDSTFNKTKFTDSIESFMVDQRTFNSEVLEETLRYLNNNLDDTKITTNTVTSSLSGNITKLEYYTTLKTMNDKWIAGTDFLNKTIFEDFLFLDRANRDIGDDFTIDVTEIVDLLENDNRNYLDLVSRILEKNHFLFFAMPAYFNFYGLQEAINNNTPIPVDIPNSLFGTYLDVDYIDARPKFLCTYIGKPSEFVSTNASFVRFKDDAFDLRKYNNPLRTSNNQNTDLSKLNRVVGFAVDYGLQNQNIFESVDLDMSEKKNTSEANRLITELGQSASGDKVAQQTASLYSIYKARSYTCSVSSMGNAMIQPTMYFNLRHVPLFYGPYWIMEVSHSIGVNNKFTTNFKGVRMPLYSLPKPDSMIETVNKNYVQFYKEKILQRNNTEIIEVSNSETLSTTETGGLQGDNTVCESKRLSQYSSIPFTDIKNTHTTESELKDRINAYSGTIPKILKPLYYGVVKTKLINSFNGVTITTPNNNFYNITATVLYNGSLVSSTVKNLVCVTTAQSNQDLPVPYFTFQSLDESILFYDSIVSSYALIIEQIKNLTTQYSTDSKKYAHAYTLFTLFYDQARYIKPSGGSGYYTTVPNSANDFITRYNDKVKPTNSLMTKLYDDYMVIYENSYNNFF